MDLQTCIFVLLVSSYVRMPMEVASVRSMAIHKGHL